MTTPRGTETLEFPRNRKGLRKNSRRDASPFLVPLFSSLVGSCNGDGAGDTILAALRTTSMVMTDCLSSEFDN